MEVKTTTSSVVVLSTSSLHVKLPKQKVPKWGLFVAGWVCYTQPLSSVVMSVSSISMPGLVALRQGMVE